MTRAWVLGGEVRSFRTALVFSAAFLITACGTTQTKPKHVTSTERARLYVNLANAGLLEGDPTGALEQLFLAEEIDSSLPELHHSKALAYAAKGDRESAMVSVKRAIKLQSNYTDANNTYGKMLVDAGRYEEALEPLTRAEADPIYRQAYKVQTNLGILQYRRGRFDLARKHFDKAIALVPNESCVAYYYRGHLQLKQATSKNGSRGRPSDYAPAVSDYTRASQNLCGGFTDAHLALGIAYEQSQQYQLARQKFVDIQNRYPNTKHSAQAMTHLRTLP